ncbi:hypothetical protein CAPTEDRAFT_197454 [Capitella teleta]|uniref:G-protein coupled receptors family 1 profile domain-containing protein n=1 Tax=Capitella teleta TaxID=283909 RepID=R7TAC3_CAPTE|nr:hypothetical protein CAPTEDRAFT_197454 [Capitella teleta]|eukprot:ELT90437.1 hypothetical protein CAPTEDRAFT_197454 [Capitella teleta]
MDPFTTELAVTSNFAPGHRSIPVTDFCIYYVFTFRIFVATILFVGGLVGNSLTIVVLWKDRNKSATVFLLICLASSDSILLIVFMLFGTPSSILRFIGREQDAQNFQNEMIAHLGGGGPTTIMLSMGFTVAVTWQRYVSVCLPYKVKKYGSVRMAKILAVVVIAVGLLFNMPRWFEQDVVYSGSASKLINTPLANNRVYTYFHGVFLYYLFFYIIPMIALIFMTIQLVRAMRESRKKREQMVSGQTKAKDELTMSLVVVVVVFVLCQTLSPIRRILLIYQTGFATRQCGGVLYFYEAISVGTNMFNSAINFVIYVLFARRFRNQISTLLGCSKSKVAPIDGTEGHSTLNTNTNTNTNTNSNTNT